MVRGDVLGREDREVRVVHGGDGLLARRRHHEHVREPAGHDSVQAGRAVLPLLRHGDAVAADDRVAGARAKGVISGSKPVAYTMQSSSYSVRSRRRRAR